jgi:hypothetical protein
MKVETGFNGRFYGQCGAVQAMKSAACMSFLEINDFSATTI